MSISIISSVGGSYGQQLQVGQDTAGQLYTSVDNGVTWVAVASRELPVYQLNLESYAGGVVSISWATLGLIGRGFVQVIDDTGRLVTSDSGLDLRWDDTNKYLIVDFSKTGYTTGTWTVQAFTSGASQLPTVMDTSLMITPCAVVDGEDVGRLDDLFSEFRYVRPLVDCTGVYLFIRSMDSTLSGDIALEVSCGGVVKPVVAVSVTGTYQWVAIPGATGLTGTLKVKRVTSSTLDTLKSDSVAATAIIMAIKTVSNNV